MSTYYVIDLQRTDIKKGIVVFLAQGTNTHTRFLEEAGNFTEAFINENLERFDNGSTTRAMLTSAIKSSSRTIVPLHNLDVSTLLLTHKRMTQRQAI